MMIDLGRKSKETAVQLPTQESKIYYPSFYIDKKIPLTDKNIGDEIAAMVKLKLVSISQRENKNGDEYFCSFDILGIDFSPKKKSHYER